MRKGVTVTVEGLGEGERPTAVIHVPLVKDDKHVSRILTAALCAEVEQIGRLAFGEES